MSKDVGTVSTAGVVVAGQKKGYFWKQIDLFIYKEILKRREDKKQQMSIFTMKLTVVIAYWGGTMEEKNYVEEN